MHINMLVCYISLCFLPPLIWFFYAAVFRRVLVKYTLFFFLSSFLSIAVSSVLQVLFQYYFSEIMIFSDRKTATLLLFSFVQTGFIEEGIKAVFLFITLKKISVARTDFIGKSVPVIFYFAVFSGFLFASFESLAGYFYLPGVTVPRLFTAYILHPAALLVTASGAFFNKRFRGAFALSFTAGFLLHGLYNLTVVFFMLTGAVVYVSVLAVSVMALWWKIGGRGILTGEGDLIPPQE